MELSRESPPPPSPLASISELPPRVANISLPPGDEDSPAPADRLPTIIELLRSFEAATQEDMETVRQNIAEVLQNQRGLPVSLIAEAQAALRDVRRAPGVSRVYIGLHEPGNRRHLRRNALTPGVPLTGAQVAARESLERMQGRIEVRMREMVEM